jgi:hypothetical protein
LAVLQLERHPENASDALHSIGVRYSWPSPGTLALSYVLEGDLDRVRIPRPQPRRIGADLWKHTCCEIFLARGGRPEYHELNFSPSGEWAAYAFTGYRDGAPLADAALDPQVTVSVSERKLELDARIRIGRLLPGYSGGPLRAGLSAVVEDDHGSFCYWALRHPPGKPDFHHRDAFSLELDEARH